MNQPRIASRGFTLVEVMVVLTLSSILLMTIALMFSALLKAQRSFSLRERQRREFSRIDAILRSDVHAATTATAMDLESCELKGSDGETWTYRRDEESLVRVRSRNEKIVQRESFRLQPGTKIEFRNDTQGNRSWLHLQLEPPPVKAPAASSSSTYRAHLLIGGLVGNAAEKSP